MLQPSAHPSRFPRIAIVGGGVASFVAGITLREKLPDASITLYCAADETMIGGQLASWNERGYPIEHGLHALFGFYDHIIPILKKVGAYENLTRSKEHIFIRERGEIRRFDLRTWPATYRGFTVGEKLRALAVLPAIGKIVLDVRRNGFSVFDAYDGHDLRALARAHGVPWSVLQSGFFRQLYEAAFNAPFELSAAVALESIYKIFSRRWHYYFNSPTRESMVVPLQRYFTQDCRGQIECNQRLVKIRTDDAGARVAGLVFRNQVTGDESSVEADEYVLALGLEDFKLLDFGPAASRHDYFRNIHKLQTVSSFSIQAWFKEDPVPTGIDSMITGMPEPFGILCPISRVRATTPPEGLSLRHELIATGPEQGYEDISDEAITAGFITGLRDAGFRIPADLADMHIVLRRNRDSFHRYLLTRPGELHLRPPHQSPLANLCLAGAWVRNGFALPCVDAAAEGAIEAAELISKRAMASGKPAPLRQRVGARRGTELVPPPYRFPHSTGSLFLLDANPDFLTRAIPPRLKLCPGFGGKVLFAALRHEGVHAHHDPTGTRYHYNEVVFAAIVRDQGFNPMRGPGLYPIRLHVDDDMAMAAGREVYGFPKELAQIALGSRELAVTRRLIEPEWPGGCWRSRPVLSAQWSAKSHAGPPLEESHPGVVSLALRRRLAVPVLGRLARSVPFYNTLHELHAEEGSGGICPGSSQLTKVALSEVQVREVAALQDLQLRMEASADEPINLLLGARHEAAEIRARRGVMVQLNFSMGTPCIVDTLRAAHAARVPHPAPRDHHDPGEFVDRLGLKHSGHTG